MVGGKSETTSDQTDITSPIFGQDWVTKLISGTILESVDDDTTHGFKDFVRKRIQTLMMRESSSEVRILMNADDFSISRVPPRFRRNKEQYYEPSVVSIGPYHRGKEGLRAMEEHKWCHLNSFLRKKTQVDELRGRRQTFSVDSCIEILMKDASLVRLFYFEYMDMRDEELVEMLLLDGCFIVETILRYYDKTEYGKTKSSSWFSRQIWEDLLLFENQIPFFILNNLYNFVDINENEKLVDIVQKYMLNRLLPMEMKKEVVSLESNQIAHLLQLFYHSSILKPYSEAKKISMIKQIVSLRWPNPLKLVSFLLAYRRSSRVQSYMKIHNAIKIPTATKLKDAGVTFKARLSENFLDITFNHGVLEIPPIILDSQRRCRMMNLIAFEQSNNIFNAEILTSYAEFMDNIIDTESDVEILQEAGIIISYLWNNEEVALFFNQLSEHKAITLQHMLAPLMRRVKEYAEVDWHRWRAYMKRYYFSNPWSIISLIAAGALLILTALQTVYTMDAYYHPPHP